MSFVPPDKKLSYMQKRKNKKIKKRKREKEKVVSVALTGTLLVSLRMLLSNSAKRRFVSAAKKTRMTGDRKRGAKKT